MRLRRRRGDGGPAWWFDDAEALHRAAPRSFFIPPIEERRELAVGRSAKLLFAFDDRVVDDVARNGERMWVEVVERCGDGSYVGSLANEPHVLTELSLGDRVEFGPEHVIAIEYTADELGYPPGDPVVLDARIIRDDLAPVLVTRAQPPGQSHFFWFGALDDEPPQERRTMTLGYLTDRWPGLAPVFSSTGGTWRRVEDSGEYRLVAPPADDS